MLVALAGCGIDPVLEPANQRPFVFGRDTFAFHNELRWHYKIDPASGERTDTAKNEDAEYSLHCFVIARSARQFFQFARFDPQLPKASDEDYRLKVHEVVLRDPSETETRTRVVFPGYASLHDFSAAHEALLKDELGSAIESYVQRGNWRMIFPFSEGHQEETAQALAAEIQADRPPIVHLILFPKIRINHAVLLFGVTQGERHWRFRVYDPNSSAQPIELTYDAKEKAFSLPANDYFPGGTVDVYEVYKNAVL